MRCNSFHWISVLLINIFFYEKNLNFNRNSVHLLSCSEVWGLLNKSQLKKWTVQEIWTRACWLACWNMLCRHQNCHSFTFCAVLDFIVDTAPLRSRHDLLITVQYGQLWSVFCDPTNNVVSWLLLTRCTCENCIMRVMFQHIELWWIHLDKPILRPSIVQTHKTSGTILTLLKTRNSQVELLGN